MKASRRLLLTTSVITTLTMTTSLTVAQAAEGPSSREGTTSDFSTFSQLATSVPTEESAISGLVNEADPSGNIAALEINQVGNSLLAPRESTVKEIPTSSDSPLVFNDGTELHIPINTGETAELLDDGTLIFKENADRDIVHVTIHESGVRVANVINDPKETHEYSYQVENASLTLQSDGSISVSQTGLIINPDGSESIQNVETSRVDAPWATDALGNPVETRYELLDNGFKQVIIPNEKTVYPIVADPNWWKIAKCTGAIVFLVGSTMFTAAKLVRVKNYIKALGGTKQAVQLLTRASTAEERLRIGGTALRDLAAEIFGVYAVRAACA